MAHTRFGCLNPNAKTIMLPVAASQYFYNGGCPAVYLDSSGHVTQALTATTTLYGFAIVPTGTGAGTSVDYWKSSATAGADYIPVIPATENEEFLMPGIITCTLAMTGGAWDLVAVNDGASTYVDLDSSSTDVFICTARGVDRKADAAATDCVVIINPAKIQAD